ncbi:MAG: AAA family ATPase, partial [Bacilli bacterium]|nr:AAA family ATPase [Bacilli bacterium]
MIPNPNIELFRKYYRGDYANEIRDTANSNQQNGFAMDVRRIRDAMKDYGDNVKRFEVRDETTGKLRIEDRPLSDEYKNTKPFLFVLPGVSRYMTRPGDPDTNENVPLTILYGATQISDTPCKLMLFVDKINDLPTWFEAEDANPSIKKLYLAQLDASFRKAFYENELKNIFGAMPEKEQGKMLERFAAFTQGYSLRRLKQLRDFIIRSQDDSDRNIRNIDKTVVKFESGRSIDPWRMFDMYKKIDELSDSLNGAIKGQEHIVQAVERSINAAVTGTSTISKHDRRPRAVFFLAGPTGTGKTEMTKRLTEVIFGNPDSMVVFDMSEFKEAHTASRLFGAPPGYVGYEAGGELTKAVKNNPFTVILFDEIEKADSSIWDKFLQILGEGRLTDGKGETVYFTKSVIVFTSNLGVTSDLKNVSSAEKN